MKQEIITKTEFASRMKSHTPEILRAVRAGIMKTTLDEDEQLFGLLWPEELEKYARSGNRKAIIALEHHKKEQKNNGFVKKKNNGKFFYVPKSQRGYLSVPSEREELEEDDTFDFDNIDYSKVDSLKASQLLVQIKVKKEIIALKKEEGKFIEIDIASQVLSTVGHSVKKAFLIMPNRLASLMEGMDFKARQRLLTDEINECLDKLSIDILRVASGFMRDKEKKKMRDRQRGYKKKRIADAK